MTNQQPPKEECCKCLPFKDSVMITAQSLSIVAIAISWVSIWGLLAGLVTFIMLQIAWCCKMNKAGFIVAGVFGAIAGAIEAIVAILILVAGEQACIDTYYYTSDEQVCWSALIVAASLGLASAFLWIATSVCVFVFACFPAKQDETKRRNLPSGQFCDII